MEVEDQATPGEVDHEDLMLEQVIEFLRAAFNNLKAHEALA